MIKSFAPVVVVLFGTCSQAFPDGVPPPPPPQQQPSVSSDFRAIGEDEQAMVTGMRHYIQDGGTMAKEIEMLRADNVTLQSDNKRLSDELAKAIELAKAKAPASSPAPEVQK